MASMTVRQLFVICLTLICLILSGCYGRSLAPVRDGWSNSTGSASQYRVQKGDTLYSIAWAYGLDYRQLAAANRLSAPYRIHTGQTLRIAAAKAQPTRAAKATTKRRTTRSTVTKRRTTKPVQPIRVANNPVKKWSMPAKGKIIKRFSTKFAGNKGIDIAGRYGEPVRASAPGRVVYSGTGLKGYGRLIIIKHNNAYLSAYANNKKLLVKEGQAVKTGQKIAEMGKNNAGKVMLHFEIRRSGKPVNPMRYLG